MYDKFKRELPYRLLDTSKYPPEVAGRFNSFITTQFDDSLSVEMQMRSIIKWVTDNFKLMDSEYNDFTDYIISGNINPFIEMLNDLIDYMNYFISEIDNRLSENIGDILNVWLSDGTLADIINEDVFNMKANQSDLEATNAQLAQTDSATMQADFPTMLLENKYDEVGITKKTDTQYELIAQNKSNGVYYNFTKNGTDDFYKMGEGVYYDRVLEGVQLDVPETFGVWNKNSSIWFTEEINAGFKYTFTGNRIRLRFYSDNRGGLFEVRVNNTFYTNYSTYTETSVSNNEIDLTFDEIKEYEVLVIFKGEDPLNPVAEPRGWLNGTNAIAYYSGLYERINEENLLHPTSNKEFAFNVTHGSESFWIPEHNNQPVMKDNTITLEINNKSVNFNTMSVGDSLYGDSLVISQYMTVENPVSAINFAVVRVQYNIRKNGAISYTGKITALNSFTINTGYPLMLAVDGSKLNTVKTSLNQQRLSEGNDENFYFNGGDLLKGVYFTTNISGYGSFVALAEINDGVRTMRIGEEDKEPINESSFLWERSNPLKFYFRSISDKTFESGDSYIWSGLIGVNRVRGLADFV